MSSSLRILAAAAALASASVAGAQTVTLYGRLDVSVERLSISSAGGSRTVQAVSDDSSRFGLSGSEDLGAGLRANFNIENGFAADSGTVTQGGAFWGRTAWVGLAGSLGEVRLGRNYSPMDDDVWSFDPFAGAGFGAHWMAQPYQARVNNSVKYVSPDLRGLQGGALASAGEGGNRLLGLGALYRNAQFGLKLAHNSIRSPMPGGGRTELMLAGDIRFGGPRVTAMYFQRKDDGIADKLTSLLIGGNVPVGSGDVRASYTRLEQGQSNTRRIALGYWQDLSKRTAVYTAYVRQSNSADFNTSLNPTFPALAGGEDINGLQLGLRHNF